MRDSERAKLERSFPGDSNGKNLPAKQKTWVDP